MRRNGIIVNAMVSTSRTKINNQYVKGNGRMVNIIFKTEILESFAPHLKSQKFFAPP